MFTDIYYCEKEKEYRKNSIKDLHKRKSRKSVPSSAELFETIISVDARRWSERYILTSSFHLKRGIGMDESSEIVAIQPAAQVQQETSVKDTKYCSECGAQINAKAEICPKCGVRVSAPATNLDKNKTVAAVLALFLGTLGIHKFYLGNTKMGLIYILISITFIGLFVTAILSLYDAIKLFTMSEAEFSAMIEKK